MIAFLPIIECLFSILFFVNGVVRSIHIIGEVPKVALWDKSHSIACQRKIANALNSGSRLVPVIKCLSVSKFIRSSNSSQKYWLYIGPLQSSLVSTHEPLHVIARLVTVVEVGIYIQSDETNKNLCQ